MQIIASKGKKVIVVGAVLFTLLARRPDLLVKFITHYRSIFICIFLLPVSAVYELFWKLRNYSIGWNRTQVHRVKVKEIQNQVLQRLKSSEGQKMMCTARPAWQTMSQKDASFKAQCKRIDTTKLYDILEINIEKQTVIVEPGVTMGQITAKLIPLGWTLAVVPELDDLTVGGLLMGFGIETSSHKYGLFQDICVGYEVVLSDSSTVWATATNEYADLFYALPWSYGTLGLLVCAELMIVKSKKYVELTYLPTHSRQEAVDLIKTLSTEEGIDFVEGILFSETEAVVMTGRLTDETPDGPINNIALWYKPWFYEHVRQFLKEDKSNGEGDLKKSIEYLPLRAYYHRHTRSIFWEMEHIISFGNNPIFRFLLGWLIPPKISFLKLTQTEGLKRLFNENFVFQDMLIPIDRLESIWQYFNDEYEIYPIWVCPHRVYNTGKFQGMLKPSRDVPPGQFEMFVDVGVYGPPRKPFNCYVDMPKMEREVIRLKGYQALYAYTYMSRDEFRQMFDHDLYDRMRVKYGAEGAFPDVYTKVSEKKLV